MEEEKNNAVEANDSETDYVIEMDYSLFLNDDEDDDSSYIPPQVEEFNNSTTSNSNQTVTNVETIGTRTRSKTQNTRKKSSKASKSIKPKKKKTEKKLPKKADEKVAKPKPKKKVDEKVAEPRPKKNTEKKLPKKVDETISEPRPKRKRVNKKRINKLSCTFPDCTYACPTPSMMARHEKSHAIREIKTFACTVEGCFYSAKTSGAISRHVRTAHYYQLPPSQTMPRKKAYKCTWENCGFGFQRKSYAIQHICEMHFKVPSSNKMQKQYNVEDDRNPYEFVSEITEENDDSNVLGGSSSVELNGMIKQPNTLRRHVCHFYGCSFSCDKIHQLTIHERIHANIRPFRCTWDDCDFASIKKSHVVQHVRRNHFRLPRSGKLQKRLNIVDDRNPYDYVAVDPALIAEKEAEVSEPPPLKKYVCRFPDCTYSSDSRSKVVYHERRHSSVRPYRCTWPDCETNYTSIKRCVVAKHIRVVHFKLPDTIQKQRELNIEDSRDPCEYISVDKSILFPNP